MNCKNKISIILAILFLSTTALAYGQPQLSLSQFQGTYQISTRFVPFTSAMVLDPSTSNWYSITTTSDTITLNQTYIQSPEYYLYPSQNDLSVIYQISSEYIQNNQVSFYDRMKLGWIWLDMQKVKVN